MAALGAVLTALTLFMVGCSRPTKEPPSTIEDKQATEGARQEATAAETARQEAEAAELAAAETARQEATAAELAATEAERQEVATTELAAEEAARQEAVAAELAATAERQEAVAAELAAEEAARQEAVAAELATAEAARQEAAAAETARQEAAAAELAAAEAARQEAVAAELAAAEAARQEAVAAELAAEEAARQEAVAAELATTEAAVAETALPTYPGPGESVEPGENIGREATGVREDILITTEPEIAGSSEPSSTDSGGRRFSLGLLNLALGAGSFVQKDWGGGLAVLAGYAAAGGLIAWELTLVYEDPLAGIPGAVGLGVAASAAIFGFIRPFFFNRNRPEAIQPKRVNFSFVPGDRGAAGVSVSYTLQY
jgi:hypothetical protein